MFHLGTAGGLAFFSRLPEMGSEARTGDISDAAEQRDPDGIGRIRRLAGARLRPDRPPEEPPPAEAASDWEAGLIQVLAVLHEARTAREEGDTVRYSLTAGFLVGVIPGEWGSGIRYERGCLKGAVLAVLGRLPSRPLGGLVHDYLEEDAFSDAFGGKTLPGGRLEEVTMEQVSPSHRIEYLLAEKKFRVIRQDTNGIEAEVADDVALPAKAGS